MIQVRSQVNFQGMVQGIVQLGVWLVLNAILPEVVPAASVEQYKSRLVAWPDEFTLPGRRQDASVTMNLLQTLKTFRWDRLSMRMTKYQFLFCTYLVGIYLLKPTHTI